MSVGYDTAGGRIQGDATVNDGNLGLAERE
jgi:hypothetical protein